MAFTIIDKSGRKIHLSKERWSHITIKHPDLTNRLEDLKNALIRPTIIVPHKFDDMMRNYYLYNREEKCYLLVVVIANNINFWKNFVICLFRK